MLQKLKTALCVVLLMVAAGVIKMSAQSSTIYHVTQAHPHWASVTPAEYEAMLKSFSYTYIGEDGNEHTATLADTATTPRQMRAMMAAIYANPAIPGTKYIRHLNPEDATGAQDGEKQTLPHEMTVSGKRANGTEVNQVMTVSYPAEDGLHADTKLGSYYRESDAEDYGTAVDQDAQWFKDLPRGVQEEYLKDANSTTTSGRTSMIKVPYSDNGSAYVLARLKEIAADHTTTETTTSIENITTSGDIAWPNAYIYGGHPAAYGDNPEKIALGAIPDGTRSLAVHVYNLTGWGSTALEIVFVDGAGLIQARENITSDSRVTNLAENTTYYLPINSTAIYHTNSNGNDHYDAYLAGQNVRIDKVDFCGEGNVVTSNVADWTARQTPVDAISTTTNPNSVSGYPVISKNDLIDDVVNQDYIFRVSGCASPDTDGIARYLTLACTDGTNIWPEGGDPGTDYKPWGWGSDNYTLNVRVSANAASHIGGNSGMDVYICGANVSYKKIDLCDNNGTFIKTLWEAPTIAASPKLLREIRLNNDLRTYLSDFRESVNGSTEYKSFAAGDQIIVNYDNLFSSTTDQTPTISLYRYTNPSSVWSTAPAANNVAAEVGADKTATFTLTAPVPYGFYFECSNAPLNNVKVNSISFIRQSEKLADPDATISGDNQITVTGQADRFHEGDVISFYTTTWKDGDNGGANYPRWEIVASDATIISTLWAPFNKDNGVKPDEHLPWLSEVELTEAQAAKLNAGDFTVHVMGLDVANLSAKRKHSVTNTINHTTTGITSYADAIINGLNSAYNTPQALKDAYRNYATIVMALAGFAEDDNKTSYGRDPYKRGALVEIAQRYTDLKGDDYAGEGDKWIRDNIGARLADMEDGRGKYVFSEDNGNAHANTNLNNKTIFELLSLYENYVRELRTQENAVGLTWSSSWDIWTENLIGNVAEAYREEVRPLFDAHRELTRDNTGVDEAIRLARMSMFPTADIPGSPLEGCTAILVEAKQLIQENGQHTEFNTGDRFEQFKSMRVLRKQEYVKDGSNPGYMFNINVPELNTFFIMTKGKLRWNTNDDWQTMFEEFSPNALGIEELHPAGETLSAGQKYPIIHDCGVMQTNDHYFSIEDPKQPNALVQHNICFYVPDRRLTKWQYGNGANKTDGNLNDCDPLYEVCHRDLGVNWCNYAPKFRPYLFDYTLPLDGMMYKNPCPTQFVNSEGLNDIEYIVHLRLQSSYVEVTGSQADEWFSIWRYNNTTNEYEQVPLSNMYIRLPQMDVVKTNAMIQQKYTNNGANAQIIQRPLRAFDGSIRKYTEYGETKVATYDNVGVDPIYVNGKALYETDLYIPSYADEDTPDPTTTTTTPSQDDLKHYTSPVYADEDGILYMREWDKEKNTTKVVPVGYYDKAQGKVVSTNEVYVSWTPYVKDAENERQASKVSDESFDPLSHIIKVNGQPVQAYREYVDGEWITLSEPDENGDLYAYQQVTEESKNEKGETVTHTHDLYLNLAYNDCSNRIWAGNHNGDNDNVQDFSQNDTYLHSLFVDPTNVYLYEPAVSTGEVVRYYVKGRPNSFDAGSAAITNEVSFVKRAQGVENGLEIELEYRSDYLYADENRDYNPSYEKARNVYINDVTLLNSSDPAQSLSRLIFNATSNVSPGVFVIYRQLMPEVVVGSHEKPQWSDPEPIATITVSRSRAYLSATQSGETQLGFSYKLDEWDPTNHAWVADKTENEGWHDNLDVTVGDFNPGFVDAFYYSVNYLNGNGPGTRYWDEANKWLREQNAKYTSRADYQQNKDKYVTPENPGFKYRVTERFSNNVPGYDFFREWPAGMNERTLYIDGMLWMSQSDQDHIHVYDFSKPDSWSHAKNPAHEILKIRDIRTVELDGNMHPTSARYYARYYQYDSRILADDCSTSPYEASSNNAFGANDFQRKDQSGTMVNVTAGSVCVAIKTEDEVPNSRALYNGTVIYQNGSTEQSFIGGFPVISVDNINQTVEADKELGNGFKAASYSNYVATPVIKTDLDVVYNGKTLAEVIADTDRKMDRSDLRMTFNVVYNDKVEEYHLYEGTRTTVEGNEIIHYDTNDKDLVRVVQNAGSANYNMFVRTKDNGFRKFDEKIFSDADHNDAIVTTVVPMNGRTAIYETPKDFSYAVEIQAQPGGKLYKNFYGSPVSKMEKYPAIKVETNVSGTAHDAKAVITCTIDGELPSGITDRGVYNVWREITDNNGNVLENKHIITVSSTDGAITSIVDSSSEYVTGVSDNAPVIDTKFENVSGDLAGDLVITDQFAIHPTYRENEDYKNLMVQYVVRNYFQSTGLGVYGAKGRKAAARAPQGDGLFHMTESRSAVKLDNIVLTGLEEVNNDMDQARIINHKAYVPAGCDLDVFNISGVNLMHADAAASLQVIDLSSLPAGIYVVTIGSKTFKVAL